MALQVSDNRGFAALIGVLIFGVLAVTTASTLMFAGIQTAKSSLLLRQSYEAQGVADACAEVALRALHDNTSYTGSAMLTLGTGSCTYTVTNLGGVARAVDVTATVARITKTISIEIDQVSPVINISSWREV